MKKNKIMFFDPDCAKEYKRLERQRKSFDKFWSKENCKKREIRRKKERLIIEKRIAKLSIIRLAQHLITSPTKAKKVIKLLEKSK